MDKQIKLNTLQREIMKSKILKEMERNPEFNKRVMETANARLDKVEIKM